MTIVLCCLGSVSLLLSYGYEAGQVMGPTYLPRTEVAALEWMSREVPREALVLSTYPTGNYIPRLSGQRVFIGEDKLTEDLNGREADVEGFFRPGWSDQERMELLHRFGVDYVFYGPEEQRVGAYDLSRAPFLQPVHQVGGVQDVALVVTLQPWSIWGGSLIAMDGQPTDDDAHVPLIFWGKGFKRGAFAKRADAVDIAPTLAQLLGLNALSSVDGRVLSECLEPR